MYEEELAENDWRSKFCWSTSGWIITPALAINAFNFVSFLR